MYPSKIWCQFAFAVLLFQAAVARGASADDDYASSAALYSASQWEEAATAFGRYLDLHSDHERATTARFFRGEALAQSGQYEAAASAHDEFLKLAPQHAFSRVARFRAGECLLLAGKNDAAKSRLEEFRQTHPIDDLNSFALAYLGEIALAAGQPDEAQGYYEQSLRDYPTGPMVLESRFGLARCRQLGGKLLEAIALYDEVALDADKPLADDARLQIGLAHYEAKKFTDAEESFSAFRTTFADSELAPQAWYWLGLSQAASGRNAEAAGTLASAAKQFAEETHAPALHAAAADAFRRLGDAPQADWHYQKLIADWSQSEWADDALLGRAELALDAGDLERASAIAAELARRYPDSPHAAFALIIRARGLIAEAKFAEAEELLGPKPAGSDEATKPQTPSPQTPAPPTSFDRQIAHLLALAQIGQKKYEAALGSLERIGSLPAGDSLTATVDEARCSALLGLARYDQAVALLQTQLEALASDDAKAAKLRVQLVVALSRSGKLADATTQIQQLPPEALQTAEVAAAVLLAAEEAYRTNDLPTAEKLFTLVSHDKVPADERSQALSGLAWTQYRLAGKQASAATFERLLSEYPNCPLAAEAAVVRARSLEDVEQFDAALATYRLVIDKYAESPLLPLALWGAGRLHDRLDQDREAAELLTQLVDKHPQFAERDAALYQLGWVQTDLKDLVAAEAVHARLTKEYPQSEYWPDAAYRLAEQAARRKENSRAIELADQVLANEKAATVRENALYLRGQLAAAEAKWDEVARFMGEHTKQFPTSAMHLSARYWQAEAAFRQADYESAEKQLAELDADSHSRRDAWLGIVPLRRAQCLAQQKQWPATLRMAEPIAQRYPQFPQQYEADYLIGRALGSQARFDEARAAYSRALQSPAAAGTETAAMAQWMTGETYFHQKRYADAIAAYELCASQHSLPRWQAAALLQAGKCRLISGDTDGARRDLERVVTEFANQPLAAEAKTRLEALVPPATAAVKSAEKPR